MGSMAERAQITVKGVVQGVGFRPFVHSLATGLGLTGYVTNTSEGVLIEVEGPSVDEFLARLRVEAPPLSRITDLAVHKHPRLGYRDFTIRQSRDTKGAFTLVSPDVSTCPDCFEELLDPADRRYLYPFINCTNCGPRYSITRSVPYDRPNTTMAVFRMCPACSAEYHDPADRRFHAQPNACPVCGPQVEFREKNKNCGRKGKSALEECIRSLRNGRIIAIKGIGGFHIACDATDHEAVRKLRERKRKSNKPFAVMVPDVDTAKRFCQVSSQEQRQLESIRRPIVLLRKRTDLPPRQALSDAISPNNQYLGCMLPYTPLHQLLFQYPLADAAETTLFMGLVMTSGNLSEEPLVHRNDEARQKLDGLVDAYLLHDRDIFMRVDDSVIRVQIAEPRDPKPPLSGGHENRSPIAFIRRSRGYAPDPIPLEEEGPEVLGCGADLKNTFTLTKGKFAIPSQHIGDMANYETLTFYEEVLENLMKVYRVEPTAIVHDLHPGYLSTQWAREQKGAARLGSWRSTAERFAIQHHYAHIGAVMAEQRFKGPVIGVAFDGTGYGTDGKLWGGEFLVARINGFERVGQLKYVPLPGGETAIREPWRTAVSYVLDAAGSAAPLILEQIGFLERYAKKPVDQVMQVARSRDLSPLSSGAGRLFDAVSALIGICSVNTFEGEAAMALEACVQDGVGEEYPFAIQQGNDYTVVDFSQTILAILADAAAGRENGLIASKFHNTLATAILRVVATVSKRTGILHVALSGGTFQNQYLLLRTKHLLANAGLLVYTNDTMPANDACISLGQAYIVRGRLNRAAG